MEAFPWIKMYPAGIPAEVKLYEHESLVALFEDCFARFRDRIAFENMGTTMTY